MRNLAIVALIVTACGCDEQHTVTGPSPNGEFVRGRVIDFRTQAGVSGVVVRFGGESALGDSRATTDPSGSYAISVPFIGLSTVSLDGVPVGTVRVTGRAFRGDLLFDSGTCISRYGALTDARTLSPVAGATVSLGGRTAISGADGWYRIDLGCPQTNLPGGTTFMYVTHPNYASRQQVVGRGIQGVRRLDLDLERR